jgi:hypothetical protein
MVLGKNARLPTIGENGNMFPVLPVNKPGYAAAMVPRKNVRLSMIGARGENGNTLLQALARKREYVVETGYRRNVNLFTAGTRGNVDQAVRAVNVVLLIGQLNPLSIIGLPSNKAAHITMKNIVTIWLIFIPSAKYAVRPRRPAEPTAQQGNLTCN